MLCGPMLRVATPLAMTPSTTGLCHCLVEARVSPLADRQAGQVALRALVRALLMAGPQTDHLTPHLLGSLPNRPGEMTHIMRRRWRAQ